MNIPDEAVEAADRVFNDLFEIGQSFGPDSIREMLEAAAPYVAAQAWDEGAKAGADYEYRTALAFERCTLEKLTPATNPYRSQA